MGSNVDLASDIGISQSIKPQVVNATTTGTAVDTMQYEAVCVVIEVGAWTDGSHAITIEDSADNSDFAAVAAGKLDGSLPTIDGAADDDQNYKIGLHGARRYVRVVSTKTGGSTGVLLAANIILGAAKQKPVT